MSWARLRKVATTCKDHCQNWEWTGSGRMTNAEYSDVFVDKVHIRVVSRPILHSCIVGK
jgi:hypothetical protein